MNKRGSRYQQICVVFDRYRDDSIKSDRRQRNTKTIRPIRRIIEGGSGSHPTNWKNVLAMLDNKGNLARFLSEYITEKATETRY